MHEQHANSEEAVQIHLDLGAKRCIGMHWGTFSLADEPMDQPPIDLANVPAAQRFNEDAFAELKIGATWRVPMCTR